MTPELWLAVFALLVVAFLIVLPPLLRRQQLESSDVADQNITIARQKLEELKQQLADGEIDQVQFEAQELELETALNDDLALSPVQKNISGQGRWMAAVLMVFVPSVLIGMYKVYGDPEALNRKSTASTAQKPLGSVDQMVTALEQRMQQNPGDVKGWVMLGRSYKYLKQFDKSVKAYEKAYQLDPNDPELMLQYADSLVMANRGQFNQQSKGLIFKALEVAPDNVTALWLAGIYKAETGDLVAGVKYLAKAQSHFSPEEDSYRELSEYITSIIKHMSEAQKHEVHEIASAQEASAAASKAAKAQVQVSVSVSEGLAQRTEPGDVVFIYATAVSGPQMPLAIVKKQVKDLPLKVTLSDQQAMSPMMKLSNFDQVTIHARVSKSGQAMKGPGDLLGTLASVSVNSDSIQHVVIDQVIGEKAALANPIAKTAQAKSPPKARSEAYIEVKVDLAAHLKSRVNDDTTVFIYAQAPSGPQMPLAIIRKQVKDLPVKVKLSDAQAMMPAMKLSGFDRVNVIARVSASGQAMKQPGDLIAYVDDVPIDLGQSVNVVINQVVK